jgi:ABC-type transport system involved in multi-copper enzyme maturation permease subunit
VHQLTWGKAIGAMVIPAIIVVVLFLTCICSMSFLFSTVSSNLLGTY